MTRLALPCHASRYCGRVTDDAFYAPNRIPASRRPPQPGEKLFEFYIERDHARWLCELRDDGVYGIEAQFWQNEEFVDGRRFHTRALGTESHEQYFISRVAE